MIANQMGGSVLTNVDGSIESATNALRTNLTNGENGAITARTYGGLINITEIDGALVVKILRRRVLSIWLVKPVAKCISRLLAG
ncbi:hypothetical protein [Vibrio taketomensis]|uniref:hypothetical protein n=1 Tax=Vibrio taketomensis TaxID=2572923 RepID=UPI001389C68B|nr:hypothetical protein [Vibrio taketomensis]